MNNLSMGNLSQSFITILFGISLSEENLQISFPLRAFFASKWNTASSLNIVFFPRILESLQHLPRQHSAAIGCTKNYQPIGVTVHYALR